MLRLISVLLCGLLMSCATTTYHWARPDYNSEQYRFDRLVCIEEAEDHIIGTYTIWENDFQFRRYGHRHRMRYLAAPGLFPYYYDEVSEELFDRCMYRKGYVIEAQPSVMR